MKTGAAKHATSNIVFFGSLFVFLLLLPRVSATQAPLTGQYNSWLAESSSCPGWAETADMSVGTTIGEYSYWGTQLLANEWGWQVNGVAPSSYTYDFYQIGPFTTSTTTSVNAQIGADGTGGSGLNSYFTGTTDLTYYMGTAGTNVYSEMITSGSNAEGVQWQVTNPSDVVILNTYYYWPQYTTGVPYSLWNPVENYQSDLTGPANVSPPYQTYGDFYSGAGTFDYIGSGSGYAVNSGCNTVLTAENSNVVYSSMSCNSTDCTQSFSAVSGYTGHNSPPTSTFTAQFGNGWGTTTTGVLQANFGDLLLATEATYSGSTTFSTPTDSLGNTWTAVAGGEYCSAYDCVEIWQAVANGNGTDTVTFHTGTSSAYTYGFLREFLGYTGTVYTYAKNSGTSGTPSVSSFSPTSDDLVIAVAASTSGNWSPGQYYYMVGTNTGWYAATEFAPGWTYGSTSAPWAAPSGGDWAELVVAYSPP